VLADVAVSVPVPEPVAVWVNVTTPL
jgi:hypothetical protein